MKQSRSRFAALPFIFTALALCATPAFAQQDEDIRPGVWMKPLSVYLPSLAEGPGDTAVYVLEGRESGGCVFVCGGTHGNEIAGVVAAVLLAERAEVLRGRLILLPRANRPAALYPDPEKPGPPFIHVPTPNGERRFAYGSRLTRPEDEGSPPLAGREAGNLDRAYPGEAKGGLTSRLAYAISRLIEVERVDLAFDLHESDPESKLSRMIIANPKNVDLAAMAVLRLEERGLKMGVDSSAAEPRGLSHREWGDRTDAKAFLIETPNPAQSSPPRGRDPFDDPALPLGRRVALQLAAIAEIISAYNEAAPVESRISISGIPRPEDIETMGLGAFLGKDPLFTRGLGIDE